MKRVISTILFGTLLLAVQGMIALFFLFAAQGIADTPPPDSLVFTYAVRFAAIVTAIGVPLYSFSFPEDFHPAVSLVFIPLAAYLWNVGGDAFVWIFLAGVIAFVVRAFRKT